MAKVLKIKTKEYGVIEVHKVIDWYEEYKYIVKIPELDNLSLEFRKINGSTHHSIYYKGELIIYASLRGKDLFKFNNFDINTTKKWVAKIKDITEEQRNKIFSFSINEKLLNYLYIRLYKDFEIKASQHKHRVSKNGKSIKD